MEELDSTSIVFDMFTVALAKGALLQESVSMFSGVGLDFSAVLEDSNRQLMVPSSCGRAKALLVRNSDVPVYVAYGQAQLGIVGFDVLQEQKLKVANLIDLGFGYMSVKHFVSAPIVLSRMLKNLTIIYY